MHHHAQLSHTFLTYLYLTAYSLEYIFQSTISLKKKIWSLVMQVCSTPAMLQAEEGELQSQGQSKQPLLNLKKQKLKE